MSGKPSRKNILTIFQELPIEPMNVGGETCLLRKPSVVKFVFPRFHTCRVQARPELRGEYFEQHMLLVPVPVYLLPLRLLYVIFY